MSAPDATKPVGAGSVLVSRYRLVRLVAHGGMASVWEAHDNVLARSVAVKVLHPHLAEDRLFLERFRREAISAARLAHPNVVATFDAGITPQGTAFIVMELIRGRTLSAFAAEHRPLPIFVCVAIAMQISDALAHAHNAGLVHRDIKPANVLVCDTESDGAPIIKVTDFGIAKAAEGLGLELTKTGMILGTPRYLSPEQIDGREPDSRADLYALGVVLFELVAGLAPFRGATEMAVAVQHLHETPARLRDLRPSTPPALDLLVAALLSKRPENRPPSAIAVRHALSRIDSAGDRRFEGDPPAGSPLPGPHDSTSVGPRAPVPPLGSTSVGSPTPARPGPPVPGRAETAVAAATVDATRSRTVAPRSRQAPPLATPPVGPPPGPRAAPRTPQKRSPNWTGRLVAALVVVALIVFVVVVANHGTTGKHAPPGTPSAAAAGPIAIRSASVFHLERNADDSVHVGYAIDGDPNTAWQSDHYFGPQFANLRHGLGLALTLDSTKSLHTLTVSSATPGWSAEVYVAGAVPSVASLAPWGAPVDAKQNVSGPTTTFDLHGYSGGAVLFWLTELAPLGPSNYTASIAEISVR